MNKSRRDKYLNLLTFIFYLFTVISPRIHHCFIYTLPPTPRYCRKSVMLEMSLLLAMPQINLCLALI